MSLDALVFAGGGNRCWWQAGLLTRWLEKGFVLPQRLAGTSAGAAIASAALSGNLETALASCKKLYAQTGQIFEGWQLSLSGLKLKFAHQHIYPDWLSSFHSSEDFKAIQASGRELLIAVSRPAKYLGIHASVMLGTVAYLLDKKIAHSLHPRIPYLLGLKSELLSSQKCANSTDLQHLLMAAGAAPPVMNPVRLSKQWAFDGGYVNNAPLPPESRSGKTLVMLTRHYPHLAMSFLRNNIQYLQASRVIPVSTWDCTHRATVQAAFDLGYADADLPQAQLILESL